LETKGKGSKMHKLIILAITIGGFVFAGTWNNNSLVVEKSDPVKNQFCLAEDTSDDDNKLERRRRGGKGNKGRKRGGNGLR
jgi:hypothetical protein